MSDVRHVFAACSHVRGAHIHMEGVGWSNVHFEKATQLPFVREGLHIKPHSVDLRKYFTFKWGVYLTGNSWSTSLKRIAATGVGLLMPDPNPYEDLTSLALAGCDCTYGYNVTRMCDSLNETWVAASLDPDGAAKRAYRSRELVVNELSLDKLMTYMHEVLSLVAGTQTLAGLDAAGLASMGYTQVTCAWLKDRYRKQVNEHLYWQVEAWMDPATCALRTEIDYLAYSAI